MKDYDLLREMFTRATLPFTEYRNDPAGDTIVLHADTDVDLFFGFDGGLKDIRVFDR
jgi:hypothetical protein